MGAVHSLRVKSPYKLLKIEKIEMENKPNEHGYLYLKCLIDDSIKFESTINASTEDRICVYEEVEHNVSEGQVDINQVDESKSKILFNGRVQNIRTSNINGIYYLEIQALTSSFQLDIKEKSRSFQNANVTYDEVIRLVLKDYSGYNYTQFVGDGKKIGRPIFQYKETDWNFLKRLASELNSQLFCDIMEAQNMFYFGTPVKASYKIDDISSYQAYKDLKQYHKIGIGHDTDYFCYELERRERYEVGDKINFKNKELYVKEHSTYSLKDEVIHKYKLCRKNGIWQTKMYNSLIGGAALEGKVLAVDGEKVKLHLDIDKNQDKGEASWFPYAPPTGSAMYSMPIVGTNARLYFPDENGEGPVVTGCVRKNGGSCAKTADTTKRYFGTEHGSELEMTPGAINIKGGSKEPLNVSFDDKVGVTITSPKKLTLNADEEVIIKTPESVKIKGESKILALKKDSQSGISIETDMHFLSNLVIEDGKDRESYPNFKDEPKQGTKPEEKKEEKKKKGFSWGKLLVAVVAVVAVAVSVATFGVGAVVAAAVIGACVGAACAVASTAIGDLASGKTSSFGTYAKNALRGAFTGAISGAVFGPFGAFESVGGMMLFGGINGMADSLINQAIDGEFSFKQTAIDGILGGLTAGLLHGAGKVFKKSMPYLKNVLEDVQQKAGTLFENASAFVKKAANKISNEIEIAGKKILNNAADKLDNAFNSIYRKADELTYNMTKKLGVELQPASGPSGYHPPEESNFFKDTLSRMVKDGEESIDDNINKINNNTHKIESEGNAGISKSLDISENFHLDDAKAYERKIDNSKYFHHDEGDFGEEITEIIAKQNGLGDDVSSMFQSGRNGIDKSFLSEGPPPKLTMIESKASRRGEFNYSAEQKLGGEKYFEKMIKDGDMRYADFLDNLEEIKKMNPGLEQDYIRVETKVKITETGFGVDEVKIKDWTKPID